MLYNGIYIILMALTQCQANWQSKRLCQLHNINNSSQLTAFDKSGLSIKALLSLQA